MNRVCEIGRDSAASLISVVAWGDVIEGNARDVLAEAETVKSDDDEHKRTAFREARDFLLELLMDGPLPTRDVRAATRDAGHMWRTIERAKSELKILTGKRADGWPWSLPQAHPARRIMSQPQIPWRTWRTSRKSKEIKYLNSAKNSASPKTLAEMLADMKAHKIKMLPHFRQVRQGYSTETLLTLPAMKLGRARFERSSHH
jgi:hypothetical protein